MGINEAENSVLDIASTADKTDHIRYRELVSPSELYKNNDHYDKSGYSDRSMVSKGMVFPQEIYSCNKGGLTSNAPNFLDEITTMPIRNKVVDITSTFDDDDEMYSYSRPRSAFIASMSGHTFLIIVKLEKYLKEHASKNKKINEQDLNHFMRAVVAFYTSRSYHSINEVFDVFKEPHIQKLFKSYGVTLDFSWPADVIKMASRDTQAYASMLGLKTSVNESIQKMGLFKSKPCKRKVDPTKDFDIPRTEKFMPSSFTDYHSLPKI